MLSTTSSVADIAQPLPAAGALVSVWHHGGEVPGQYEAMLSSREQSRLSEFRAGQRRAGYVSGRILAKRTLRNCWNTFRPQDDAGAAANVPDWKKIEILADDDLTGRPTLFVDGRKMPGSLSITHTRRWTAVSLASRIEGLVGIDAVEIDGTATLSGQSLWFAPLEQVLIDSSSLPSYGASIVWAFKEAAYKSLGEPVPFVPRDWELGIEGGEIHMQYRSQPYPASITLLRLAEALLICVVCRNSSRPVLSGPAS